MEVMPVRKLAPSTRIQDEFEKSLYWTKVLSFWRLPPKLKHFPAANPVSIQRSDFEALKNDKFMCGLKTDGVRHMLLLTTKPKSTLPIAIMIDRAKNMYEVEIWAHEEYFLKGTLIDGELVWNRTNKDSMIYVAFDVILCRGEYLVRESYKDRLNYLHSIILCVDDSIGGSSIEQQLLEEQKIIAQNNDYNIRMIPKRCVSKNQLNILWGQRFGETHANDGIIFTMDIGGLDTGTSKFVYKWKSEHTIDIYAQVGKNGWEFKVNSNIDNSLIDINEIGASRTFSVIPNKLLDALQNRQPCIIECILRTCEENKASLEPERQRTDKSTANNVRTVLATLLNVEENITAEEIFTCIN